MKTPWEYADATNTEHAHQTALFMWANMASKFGPLAAADPLSYCVKDYVHGYGTNGNLPIPQLSRLFAIKNAGHGDKIRGNHSRAEGIKPGVPDTCLPVPVWRGEIDGETGKELSEYHKHGLYIELKRPVSTGKRAGVTSSEQDDWQDYLRSAGYAVDVCHGWLAAKNSILTYLGL